MTSKLKQQGQRGTQQIPPAPSASSEGARAVMKGNRSSETAPERALRSALHAKGFRFYKNRRPDPTLRCRADIVFPSVRVAVFVDGCFWHRCPFHGNDPETNSTYWKAKLDRNVQRDRDNDKALRSAGWTVVRIWEHQDPQLAAKKIGAVVSSQRTLSGRPQAKPIELESRAP